jgi:hypothetical protein
MAHYHFCNVLLISLRIKEPWNDLESPRNINIDTFSGSSGIFAEEKCHHVLTIQKLSKCRTLESPQ